MLRVKRTRKDEKCRNEKTKKSDYIHAKDWNILNMKIHGDYIYL